MRIIDLNADMGEYTDEQSAATEAALMSIVTSCSIACGGHIGDEDSMRRTIRLAKANNVQIGAHPAYPDPAHFGRRSLSLPLHELFKSLNEQIASLGKILQDEDAALNHIKPHGALYNDAAKDDALAEIIVEAANGIMVLGPPGSALETAAHKTNTPFAAEGFIDRLYKPDGSLTPRSSPGAIIKALPDRIEQAIAIATGAPVKAHGGPLRIDAQTLCIHSDTPGAVESAQAVRNAVLGAGVDIRSLRSAPS